MSGRADGGPRPHGRKRPGSHGVQRPFYRGSVMEAPSAIVYDLTFLSGRRFKSEVQRCSIDDMAE
jgi:hypothetical protein